MKNKSKQSIVNIIICVIFFIIIVYIISNLFNISQLSVSDISNLTDIWIREVTINHDPNAIYNLFCSDGNLLGTVSQIKRKGIDIMRYFDYFAKLPGIKVLERKYNISKITSNVFLNTAFITWDWDGLDAPIVARMTFIYRNKCIFQLHSSAMPEFNETLKDISDMR